MPPPSPPRTSGGRRAAASAPRTARAATLGRPRSRTCTPSRPEPTAAPAAAPRRAWRAPRPPARRPPAPCAPSATPAPSRPSSDLLRVDVVLVVTVRRRKTHRQAEGREQIRSAPVHDLDDLSLLHTQHLERERTVASLAGRAQVDRHRWLQVRPRRHEQVRAGRGVLLAAALERV